MASIIKLSALGLAAGLVLSAAPAVAQPDAHQRTLAQLRTCRDTQNSSVAHLNDMARGRHGAAAHRQAIANLNQCRDYLTAALAHLDDMARMSH